MLAKQGSAFIAGALACVAYDECTMLDSLLARLFAGIVLLKYEAR